MAKYTKRQMLTVSVFCVAQFCNAMSISLQAPFYPIEAERQGATASQYGFVFGINEIVIFFSSPLYAHLLKYVDAKTMNNMGSFTVGITCILFGFLQYVNNTVTFLTFSFLIRIIEATGTASFLVAAFSIIAKEFPQSIGETFAMLESSFGIGLIVGPAVGGFLYQVGGFKLPFIVLGCALNIAAMLIYVLLPRPEENEDCVQSSNGIFYFIRQPPIILAALTIFTSAMSIGFVTATLEPHLEPLGLSPFHLGIMFILSGCSYAILSPFWGKVCDHWMSPQAVWSIGAIFIIIAFMLLGPAPYLNLKMTWVIVVIALLIHGLGLSCQLVATFSALHKDSIALGLPDDISTYGLVSSVWTSFFALGNFVGPAISGILFDTIGFSWGSQIICLQNLLLFIITAIYTRLFRRKYDSQHPRQLLVDVANSLSESLINKEHQLTPYYQSVNGL